MATVTVAPNSDEWELSRTELEDLVASLKDEGHDAWLQEPRDGEYRAGGIVTDPLIDLSLFLWENVREEVVGALVALAIEKLRRKGRRRRKAGGVIYGPDGEVLRRFKLPSEE